MSLIERLARGEPYGHAPVAHQPWADKARFAGPRLVDRQIDELIGLCKGVIADGEVSHAEAEMLLAWLSTNQHALDRWPANALYPRLHFALADGVFDLEEQRDVLALISDMTGGSGATQASEHSRSTALPLTEPPPRLYFEDAGYCLTGAFYIGKRKEVERALRSLGATCQSSPSKARYLVIGEVGSKSWIHSTHGRKIEKALEINERTHGSIALVGEQHFVRALERAGVVR